ncbi:hypothetical protein PFICI_05101 [Pestalotiopsis fici W106-1]|uniref:Uncharacterized protein n=1 Tax=Pestalotiopsis fici (strain W106-1 / CGMCC3.15140) TaxID=1229662 RepID=W3XB20_PESFW|nr:uncharacterized protein PFICI_05101 [Pestalotiopsis fici W106-1]ETS83225.1 hypothetical protein PFICI_05101 [Pestalotiopsis fici W106-1]
MQADDFDWIVEQQRHAFERMRSTAYEELSSENGSLRQQLAHAQIREDKMSKVLEHYRAARADLEHCLANVSIEIRGDDDAGDDWIIEQRRLYDQYTSKHLEDQKSHSWTEEDLSQQYLDEWVQVAKDDVLPGSGAWTELPFESAAFDDPPPPYEEQDVHELSIPRTHEKYLHDAQQRSPPSPSPHVRFAAPHDIIPCATAPCCPSRKRKKPKKEVIALYRKRGNRSAV